MDVSLKEHIEARLTAIEKEIEKSERILAVRLESMNEVRGQLKDQAATMATRDQLDTRISFLTDRITSLENSRAYTFGVAAGLSLLISLGVVIFGKFFA